MQRQAVESKLLQSVGYDPETKTLECQFQPNKKNPVGRIYQYADVLPEEYEALKASASIGRYFLKTIQPNRVCTAIAPEEPSEEKTQASAEA